MQQANKDGIAVHDAYVKVWDLPIRVFHWVLVAGFAAAYFTAKYRHGDLHALIGYALTILLAARLVWGFFGSRYSRFNSFIFSISETLGYVRSMRNHQARHYLGHNPAGALMVFALLALLALIFSTGLMTLAVIDFEGPLLAFLRHVGDEASYAIRYLHALLTNIALALVGLHVLGVVAGSIQHGENLVRAMVTGRKMRPSNEADMARK